MGIALPEEVMRIIKPLLAVIILATVIHTEVHARSKSGGTNNNNKPTPFLLASPDLTAEGNLVDEQAFNGFGCTGGNTSPALTWTGVPPGTKSFALMVHDPDAPTGGAGWWHWVVINISATVNTLPKGFGKPENAAHASGLRQIRNDFGTLAWGGPCPPVGAKPHSYIFTLYALKTEKIDFPVDATASFIGFLINSNTISKATLKARYARPALTPTPAVIDATPQHEKAN